jgi:serine/threonine protein phosphatase PrpC
MQIQYAARSETGLKRANNEDSYKIELSNGQTSTLNDSSILLAVADGLGGHPCGEVASMMACQTLTGFLDARERRSGKDLQSRLVKIFYYIDNQIRQHTSKNPSCLHMGTTLSVIVIFGEKAVIAHVGDTRIYCLRDGKLRQLTTDNTFVQEMLNNEVITAEMAAASPNRNVLIQVVGTDEPLEDVCTQSLDIFSSDRFLLSSDGLHDTVSFNDIEMIMKEGDDPEETAGRLLSQAIVKGGTDDITLIVAHVT